MDKETEIKQIQKDSDFCWELRKKLILVEGLPLDNAAIQHLDEKIWYLMLRLYVLTETNGRRKAKILGDLGLYQN